MHLKQALKHPCLFSGSVDNVCVNTWVNTCCYLRLTLVWMQHHKANLVEKEIVSDWIVYCCDRKTFLLQTPQENNEALQRYNSLLFFHQVRIVSSLVKCFCFYETVIKARGSETQRHGNVKTWSNSNRQRPGHPDFKKVRLQVYPTPISLNATS